ncbi:probable cytochrome P450 4d14 [Harmonia axyridis]|uniref:probable cytochrome P450 4d14 n=1 Tax=Harmonia axyridis TaxID=115357 RepID=UPI001E2795CA|nr:probable cytochrome P450 4d14 [Harmonia axyridis]
MILEALVVIAIVCVCYWYTSSPKYRIGNFPKPPGYFLIGHAPYINSSEKLLPYLHKQLDKFDGLMQIHIGTEVMLTASNYKFVQWLMTSTTIITKSLQYSFFNEWLGHALLITSGSRWKSYRKILTPAFHFKRIENLISVCQKASDDLIKKMSNNLDKDCFDVYPIISNFSLDVLCESSMATSINAQEEESEYRSCIRTLCQIILERAMDPLYMHDLLFYFHPQYQNFQKSIKTIHEFDQTVIEKRRKLLQNVHEKNDDDLENVYGKKKTPFLDILLKARDEDGNPLSNKDIRDQVDGIMFAGHDTTASAISFILYNLSVHPDVQEKVFNEQSEIYSKKTDAQITYADLVEMKYLEMVIKESLRIHTPIPFFARKLEEDTYYDGKLIPKNTTILILLHHLHRNAEVFPDPEKFDPTRFDDNSKIPNFAFLPFSAGLRNCIGQRFAMLEIKVAVAELVRNFEFLPAPNYKPNVISEISLKSSNGICIRLKKRQ